MAFEVYSHRGFHPNSPENTLNAFRLAYEFSPNIELDTRLTKDKIPVVIHDDVLDTTTDGHGLVSETCFNTIRTLKTRARNGPSTTLFNERIPSLNEVLHNMPAETNYQIELKHPGVVGPVSDCLSASRIPADKVFFTSFYQEVLKEAKAQSPSIRRLFLISSSIGYKHGLADVRGINEQGLIFQGVGLADSLPREFKDRLKAEDVEMFRKERLQIGCYLVDSSKRARTLEQWGVDGIVTDRIDLFKDFK